MAIAIAFAIAIPLAQCISLAIVIAMAIAVGHCLSKVIHALNDKLVPCRQGQKLYELCPHERKLLGGLSLLTLYLKSKL